MFRLVFFMLASIYFLLLSEDKTKDAIKYAAFSGVFFGLALMTKQLEALLIPAIMLVYLLSSRGVVGLCLLNALRSIGVSPQPSLLHM